MIIIFLKSHHNTVPLYTYGVNNLNQTQTPAQHSLHYAGLSNGVPLGWWSWCCSQYDHGHFTSVMQSVILHTTVFVNMSIPAHLGGCIWSECWERFSHLPLKAAPEWLRQESGGHTVKRKNVAINVNHTPLHTAYY